MARSAVGVRKRKRDGKWRARYRDDLGREHEKTFDTWEDARDWRLEQLAAVATGSWVNPLDGRVTFKVYAEKWRAGAGHRAQSAATVESRLRLHVYPALGHRPLADLRHSECRAWVSSLDKTMAPWTAFGVHAIARTVLNAAVADRIVARSPFERIPITSPKRQAVVVPLTVPEVRLLLSRTPAPHYRALFALGAATGARGGELLGLTLDSVDFLRRTVRIERQLVWIFGEDGKLIPAWGPPKTRTSVRTLDVPEWALKQVAAYLARRPAAEVTLPVVDTPRVTSHTGQLVFTTGRGRPIRRNGLADAWNGSVRRAGLTKVRGQGLHALRHHVASLLIDAGESVKVVQAQLGHANAAETWDTYAHLFPDTEGRTRSALERAWQADEDVVRGDCGETGRS